MSKNKKKLLSSDYYSALESLRTGGDLHTKKNGGLTLPQTDTTLINHADTKSLGFEYMTTKEIKDLGSFVHLHPQRYKDALNKLEAKDIHQTGIVYDSQIETVLKEYPQIIPIIRMSHYAKNAQEEFTSWVESNKFEIDWGSIEEILPTGVAMHDFFSHVQSRLPYEKCLYIAKINPKQTLFLGANEIPIDDQIDFWSRQRRHMNVVNKQSKDATGDKDLDDTLNRWKIDGIESVANVRISARVDGEFVFVPSDIILPIGVAISELVNPRYTPQVINKGKFTQIIEVVIFLERKLFEKKADDKYRGSGFFAEMALTVVCYSSVLLDPQFREFAIKEEFYGGLNNDFLRDSKFININTPIAKNASQRPMFEHKVLTLNIPKDVKNPRGRGNRKEGTRLHSVRGHMMKTKKGKLVWRKAHWRGKQKFGVIKKEYNIPNQQAV